MQRPLRYRQPKQLGSDICTGVELTNGDFSTRLLRKFFPGRVYEFRDLLPGPADQRLGGPELGLYPAVALADIPLVRSLGLVVTAVRPSTRAGPCIFSRCLKSAQADADVSGSEL